jgi:type I restriction enzyme, R subunit
LVPHAEEALAFELVEADAVLGVGEVDVEHGPDEIREAEALPVFKIDKDYVTKIDELPSPSDKAAALEAALTAELSDGDAGFTYRQLGERMRAIKERKDATDKAAAEQLRLLEEIADEVVQTKAEPQRLGLTRPGEYGLYTVLRAFASTDNEAAIADCARRMVAHLVENDLLSPGWSNSRNATMRVEQSLLAESWNPEYAVLGFAEEPDPPFLKPAVEELSKSDVG